LFWKKKSDNNITIELDSDDRRNGVRIKPVGKIIIHYNEQHFNLLDISFSGLAFQSKPEAHKVDDTLDISMSLPLGNKGVLSEKKIPISCQIKIVHTLNSIYHCRFVDLKHQSKLVLDRFILNEQKRQIISKINSE